MIITIIIIIIVTKIIMSLTSKMINNTTNFWIMKNDNHATQFENFKNYTSHNKTNKGELDSKYE